jgi:hypothetical protein
MRVSDLHKRILAGAKETRYVATFNTANTSAGSSASNQVALPLLSTGGTYNFTVEWGDGTSDLITSGTQAERTHTYASAGVYDIKISGLLRGWRFADTGDRLKILEIKNWGKSVEYTSVSDIYRGCNNMNFTAIDSPVFLGTNKNGFFRACTSLIGNSSINNWDVSNTTDFGFFFQTCILFNYPLNSWNVSNSTIFNAMFQGATVFNQPINNWNVGNAQNFTTIFNNAASFNQPLNNWNVSSVTNFTSAFNLANSFAQSLGNWSLNSAAVLTTMLNVSSSTIGTNLQEWYSRTLIGWANDVFARGGVPSNRSLGANNRRYNNIAYTTGLQFNDAVSARSYLVNSAGWTISGDAQI